jgi:glycine cleavage system H protein
MSEASFEFRIDKWLFHVPKDRYYNENDSWVKIDKDIATVGITDFRQTMVGDIVFVELPEPGTAVEQFDEASSFESVKTVLDLISPVSGVIKEINGTLLDNPELVNHDPYGDGWFIKVEVKDFTSDKQNLLSPEGYFDYMKRKAEEEQKRLKGIL